MEPLRQRLAASPGELLPRLAKLINEPKPGKGQHRKKVEVGTSNSWALDAAAEDVRAIRKPLAEKLRQEEPTGERQGHGRADRRRSMGNRRRCRLQARRQAEESHQENREIILRRPGRSSS